MDDPITRWIEGLRAGDDEAIGNLWNHYFDRLVGLARVRLGASPRRVADEEDIALSVFRCLCAGAETGRLADMSHRDDLWRVLVTMTVRKTIDQQRRAGNTKRGGGRVRGESMFLDRHGEERAARDTAIWRRWPHARDAGDDGRRGDGDSLNRSTMTRCSKLPCGSWKATQTMRLPTKSV